MEDTDFTEDPSPPPITRIGLADLLSPARLQEIYTDTPDYYWSDEWTPEFFVAQAKAGFISVSHEVSGDLGQILLPQIHTANAVLDWENLHISRSTKRWMKSAPYHDAGYTLRIGHDLDAIIAGIAQCHGEDNWMCDRYPHLLRKVAAHRWIGFELLPIALIDKAGTIIAGEIGYATGSVYTSMSGFLDRSRPSHNHVGKLQLLRLGEHLRDQGFAFWNLGQPYMQYKFDLGAKKIARADFLARWHTATRTAPVAT